MKGRVSETWRSKRAVWNPLGFEALILSVGHCDLSSPLSIYHNGWTYVANDMIFFFIIIHMLIWQARCGSAHCVRNLSMGYISFWNLEIILVESNIPSLCELGKKILMCILAGCLTFPKYLNPYIHIDFDYFLPLRLSETNTSCMWVKPCTRYVYCTSRKLKVYLSILES